MNSNSTQCKVQYQILSLATDSRAPGTVYAGTEGAGVYKSTDGGTTWIRYPNPPPNSPFNQGWRSDCLESAEVVALLVDESQPTETLYAGAQGSVGNTGCNQSVGGTGVPGQGPGFFLFKASDPLWGRKMNGMYGADVPATFTLNVWAIARVGSRVYAATDFGVFTTTDQAGSWDGVPRMHGPPAAERPRRPAHPCAGHLAERRHDDALRGQRRARHVQARGHRQHHRRLGRGPRRTAA